jgi:flagellar basal-body rod modification protein FlgD
MTITATTSTATTASTAASSSSSSTSSTSSLSSQDFMTLLVSELQNQNPLDPTNTTDFVNQLTSYASYQQQTTLNTNLNSLATSFNSLLTLNATNYIGHTVEAKGDTATLSNGTATFGYSLTSAASDVTLTVKDSSGNTVWTGSGTTTSGKNSFTWDGTNSAGTQLTDGGQYTLSVAATDASGNSVYDYTTVSGKVTGVDSSSGTTDLTIGSSSVKASDVIAVTS